MKRKCDTLLLVFLAVAVVVAVAVILIWIFWPDHLADKKVAEPIVITNPKNDPAAGSVPENGSESASEPAPESAPEPEQSAESAGEQSASGSVQELQGRLEQMVSTEYGAGGNVAVCAGRAAESEMAAVNGGPMQAASLIKLYVAGCVYENYGNVSSYDSYSGETESLLKSMITVSDNTACNTLVTRLGSGSAQNGMALVNQYCVGHGFFDTHMGRLMLQPNDADDNYTSVQDCCNFLKMANAGQLEGSSSILNYMNQQERRGKIPAGLPAGVSVGNKTGELSDVENDAAVIYADSGTYVLCVMSEHLSDAYSARQFIIRVSGAVYEMMQ